MKEPIAKCFELQNLTEVGPTGFGAQELHIGLCGLAYRARVRRGKGRTRWTPLEKAAPARAAHENDWSLSGRVIAFKPLRNPLSGGELFWIHLDLERKLEVLVNQRALRGDSLAVGATLDAEVCYKVTCSTNMPCVRATKASIMPVRARVSGPDSDEEIEPQIYTDLHTRI